MLDLTALRKALAQAEEALQLCASETVASDPRLARHLRAAAVQAFEFTYEVSVKMLRRHLAATESNPGSVAELTFNELIRLGLQRGLLHADLEAWRQFRADRGSTSHIYDERTAEEVFAAIPRFVAEARLVLHQLEARQEP